MKITRIGMPKLLGEDGPDAPEWTPMHDVATEQALHDTGGLIDGLVDILRERLASGEYTRNQAVADLATQLVMHRQHSREEYACVLATAILRFAESDTRTDTGGVPASPDEVV